MNIKKIINHEWGAILGEGPFEVVLEGSEAEDFENVEAKVDEVPGGEPLIIDESFSITCMRSQILEPLHLNSRVLLVDSMNTFLRSFAMIPSYKSTGKSCGRISWFYEIIRLCYKINETN